MWSYGGSPPAIKKKEGGASSEQQQTEETHSNEPISEEAVFNVQNRFEKRLGESYLPDAVSRDALYTYWKLIRVWYSKLAGENRYNDEMTQKLRRDWLDYMEAVEDRSTYNYLSLESEGKESEEYREKHILASRKKFAIEDAFAAASGKEAVGELARIRALDYSSFSRTGELAPEDFRYDLADKLQPVTKHSPKSKNNHT